MNQKLFKIIVSAILLIGAVIVERMANLAVWQLLIVYLVPYLLVGYDVIKEALVGLAKGNVFNENFLMVIATFGALCIGFLPGSATEFPEAVFVMLFFQVGELFEDIAEGHSRKSISDLMNIRPDSANVLRGNAISVVSPETIAVGEIIVIKPGEKVPLDGIVMEGSSNLDTVALTGESLPREINVDDTVISGCVNISGLLKVKVTKDFGQSTVSKIINLVENSSVNKSKSETFIAKFARVYTPIVVSVALALAILPPLFSYDFMVTFPVWLNRALTFLVVSCPCALVISVPLTFFGGIGGASKNGILIKGGNYMETLAKIGIVVFDKTGTLTEGKFEVSTIHPNNINENQLLHLAAHVERFSTHPIAISLRNAYPNENDDCKIEDIEEISGHGIRAKVNGEIVCVGNTKMMDSIGAKWKPCEKSGTIIHIAVNGLYVGHIVISDKIKEDSKDAIAALKAEGIEKTIMLTGDRKEVGEAVAKELCLDEYHAELLPADKVKYLERIIKEKKRKTYLAFVGDGINDAPVLARADVGIAMGGLGSDAAIEAADVVLMDDKPNKIAVAVNIARRTIRIARQNVFDKIKTFIYIIRSNHLNLIVADLCINHEMP
jgi:Cd2+/Zn2+-exporting ATPase